MHTGRQRLAAAAVSALLVGSGVLWVSSPAQAEPTVESAQARVDTLYREAEQASERLNEARLEVTKIKRQLQSLRADQRSQASLTDAARTEARDAILRAYQGQDMSAVNQVVGATDLGDFLDQMSTMSSYADITDELYSRYDTQARALTLREKATEKRVARLASLRTSLAEDKAEIDSKLADAQAVLDELEAAERREVISRTAAREPAPEVTTVTAAVSGSAGDAVAFALAQVGDSYVYGATGPDSYDCSGLTMQAWAAAGVSLPHSSSAQYASGTKVSISDLQPGDLVFYYSPISHVGIYIGNGQIVDAANPSTGVRVAAVDSMPISGAVRPG
ncbi:C40 family peptidase [Nocardioides bruguierae]|uniref:C40 family peptidase n=1 Tax=Nocardioides bruguierae TaxID=2945102 RepID=UPI002021A22A|nr:C40 family peptidase [Nocardioides bruguierae]MCL8027044.1 NlpC/P60 family protein [Nocardioides bruguierae]